MFRMHPESRAAAVAAAALAVVCASPRARAQTLPSGIFAVDRFACAGSPTAKSLDGDVRITNPGSIGLKAWGAHVEITPDGSASAVTETPFQETTLSPSELDELTGRCAAIVDNGSGAGRCYCRPERDAAARPGVVEPGTLCANLYVFAADQQLAECCSCPLTPDGLVTVPVRDLTSNPLTGDVLDRGVVAILTSLPSSSGECDPTVPQLPVVPTTTTTTTSTSTTTSTTVPGASTTTTVTTPLPTTTTSTTEATTAACDGLAGVALVDCTLGEAAAASGCDSTTASAGVRKQLRKRMRSLQHRLDAADARGGTAWTKAMRRAGKQIDGVEHMLTKAAKRRHVSASCMTAVEANLAAAQAAMDTLE
ncbi:MAG: hypothetical protein KIT14_09665 [bacterium]|nr:hypothetical protein [bacterium]